MLISQYISDNEKSPLDWKIKCNESISSDNIFIESIEEVNNDIINLKDIIADRQELNISTLLAKNSINNLLKKNLKKWMIKKA